MLYIFQSHTTYYHHFPSSTSAGYYSISLFDDPTSSISRIPSVTRFNVPPSISYVAINSALPKARVCSASSSSNLSTTPPYQVSDTACALHRRSWNTPTASSQRDDRTTPGCPGWFRSRSARAQVGLVPTRLLESVHLDCVDKYSTEPRDMWLTSRQR